MQRRATKPKGGLNQELGPGAVAAIACGIVIVAAVLLLAVHNPFRGVPPPPKGKLSAGGPPIPPPPGPGVVRHGPIGP
jgi:hypothetical protein